MKLQIKTNGGWTRVHSGDRVLGQGFSEYEALLSAMRICDDSTYVELEQIFNQLGM